MRTAAVAVRFVLEVAALAALAYWGVRVGTDFPSRLALGLAAPMFAAGVWATFVAPRAPFRLPALARLAVELGVFGLAVAALAVVGRPTLAVAFGAAAFADSVGLYLLERGGA
ncbi:YrdB family protein [Halosegnis marinus]|uniref:YrdB family protein n=1 Tax=Halosegnis marinus TaxID=3034023 RepID=A0ABD5ZMJ3_9EURY|nr:YrdB family protein [Halosegnis sp. DT85]